MQAVAKPVAVPARLSELNARLADLGLPRLDAAALQRLLEREPRERVLRAVVRAGTDPGSRAYLEKRLRESLPAPPAETAPGLEDDRPPSATAHAASTPAAPPADVPEPERGERYSVHVYGAKGALCWEADVTRAGYPTLLLEAALASGPRRYDWSHKLRLQLTRHELILVLSVLLGLLPRGEFKNHGESNHKGFSIEDQGNKFFIQVFAKGQSLRAVPMEPEDAFQVAALLIRQLCAALPWLSGAEVVAPVRATVGRMKQVQPPKEKED